MRTKNWAITKVGKYSDLFNSVHSYAHARNDADTATRADTQKHHHPNLHSLTHINARIAA